MASPPTIHSLWHGKCGLTHHKFCRQTTFKKGKGGGSSNFFFSLHQHDLFLYGGCYKDYEYSRKCSSTEAAPHVTLPTFPKPLIRPSSRLYIKSIGHQNIQSSLSLHRWYGHPESHTTGNTTFFFWPRPLHSFFQYACRTMMGQQNF